MNVRPASVNFKWLLDNNFAIIARRQTTTFLIVLHALRALVIEALLEVQIEVVDVALLEGSHVVHLEDVLRFLRVVKMEPQQTMHNMLLMQFSITKIIMD